MERILTSAREFFCAARDAVQRIATYDQRVEAKRQLAVMKARREGPSGRGGVTDPSKRIDDLIDTEMEAERGLIADQQLALRASRVLEGYALVDRRGASIVRMRYLRLMPWAAITEETGLPYDMCRSAESVAFDRIDSEGISAIESGALRTTGAE